MSNDHSQPINSHIVHVPLALIDTNPHQARSHYDPEELEQLADSIRSLGLINPITLQAHDSRYTLLAGSRRLAAHEILRRDTIPAIILTLPDSEQLAVLAHENLYRADLTPLEEAQFLQTLANDESYTPTQLSKLINKPISYVEARLKLLTLPPYLTHAVHTRQLSITAALELAKFDNDQVREQYTHYAISTGASIQTLRYWLHQYNLNKCVPTNPSDLPQPVQTTPHQTVFGWYCYSCDNFHPAERMQTIHVCQPCFIDLETARKTNL